MASLVSLQAEARERAYVEQQPREVDRLAAVYKLASAFCSCPPLFVSPQGA